MSPKKDASLLITVSSNIRNLRKKRYSQHGGQTKCAQDFGVGVTTWNGWESGRSIPSDAYQRELALFFGISIGELRGETLPDKYPLPAQARKGESILIQLSMLATELQGTLNDIHRKALTGEVTVEQFQAILLAATDGMEKAARENGVATKKDIA